MKILILGAGQVGTSVAENLVSEHNDITVIDTDGARLALLQDRLDLRGLMGNGTHISTLQEAGAADADLFISCATADESNLVACKLAKQVFNVPRCIARVRSSEFLDHEELMGEDGFDVDHLICPERSVTSYIEKLVEIPEALQVVEFADGRVCAVTVRAAAGSPLAEQPIESLRDRLPGADVRIIAIFRNNRLVVPEGDTRIEPGDEVLFLANTRHVRHIIRELRESDKRVKRVMIAGGGNIGLRLARSISDHCDVKVIEHNRKRCEFLATQLPSRALILNADATDEDLLEDENVAEMDLFLALTSDDEDNIMSSLLAKRMGARRVIALISRKSYGELMEGGRIDIAISPSEATIGELLRYVRRGDVVAVHRLRHGVTEALEAIAHGDAKSSQVVGRRIEDINLPAGATIGAVVRQDEVLMAHHDTVIESDDHVIVFVAHQRLIAQVEKLFQVSATFF
ncbi:Trk system potassium transport protein TrkA [Pigmentiphaga sp. NML080357]|uniref:Trk system potassium transporter TrkA n=1 Tax=Pigmentiphaga sp. NML080357 TaxID=2008675 RepID=UPI000B41F1CC|nr:Trk system potassium transporter TrkA [Pigmentiphaga sp. NML080357]OVZ64815.1 Trk system potassium transport protein TrkA [Pigmentiphaga sp. NML080357]